MNPYFEQEDVWSDFHSRIIYAISESLAVQIRPNYFTRIEQRLYVREMPAEWGRFLGRSDISVLPVESQASSRVALGVIDAPAHVRLPEVDFERIGFVEIRDRRDRRIVTAIEVLSPTNKYAGPDREQYLRKRAEILHSQMHFVEIDLLRGGPRMPMEDMPNCDYCVLVSRATKRPDAGVWPISIRDSLPTINIPLREDDPDAKLDLQRILHAVYDAAFYESNLYEGAPYPQLTGSDLEWATNLVKSLGPAL